MWYSPVTVEPSLRALDGSSDKRYRLDCHASQSDTFSCHAKTAQTDVRVATRCEKWAWKAERPVLRSLHRSKRYTRIRLEAPESDSAAGARVGGREWTQDTENKAEASLETARRIMGIENRFVLKFVAAKPPGGSARERR